MKQFLNKNKKGFTIFFATLVASLALAIGIAIYDITIRQLALSSTVQQSEYAIYAADTGAECALYWDAKYGGSGSAFATSSASAPPYSGIVCGSFDVAAQGTPPTPFQTENSNWSHWGVVANASAATTTFSMTFPGVTYCATVQVGKTITGTGAISTTIYSHGYNTCAVNAQSQLERELRVSY
jgi:hypothetical protein